MIRRANGCGTQTVKTPWKKWLGHGGASWRLGCNGTSLPWPMNQSPWHRYWKGGPLFAGGILVCLSTPVRIFDEYGCSLRSLGRWKTVTMLGVQQPRSLATARRIIRRTVSLSSQRKTRGTANLGECHPKVSYTRLTPENTGRQRKSPIKVECESSVDGTHHVIVSISSREELRVTRNT